MPTEQIRQQSDFSKRVEHSKNLTPQQKLILGLLEGQLMTTREIVDTLMSEPYHLSLTEIHIAVNDMIQREILKMDKSFPDHESQDLRIYLTFTHDWVFRF